uniref:Uncharacterized protein n=1 Tax=Panagrolaimus davidi TaxID=227884 RepID=A0A914QYW6_9BILA
MLSRVFLINVVLLKRQLWIHIAHQQKNVQSRTCQCGFYSPSLKANKSHKESLCCIEGELSLSDFEEEDDELLNLFKDLSVTDKDEVFPILSYDTVSAHSVRFLPN